MMVLENGLVNNTIVQRGVVFL